MKLFNFLKKPQTEVTTDKQPKAKVLVADDELVLREFYQDLFTRQGYQVFAAANGHDALTLAFQNLPDLILLDIMMPGIDGFEVVKQLSSNEQTKNIPVILLTNAGNIENMDKAKAFAVYKFFIKVNVSPEELLKTVAEGIQFNHSQSVPSQLETPTN